MKKLVTLISACILSIFAIGCGTVKVGVSTQKPSVSSVSAHTATNHLVAKPAKQAAQESANWLMYLAVVVFVGSVVAWLAKAPIATVIMGAFGSLVMWLSGLILAVLSQFAYVITGVSVAFILWGAWHWYQTHKSTISKIESSVKDGIHAVENTVNADAKDVANQVDSEIKKI